MIHIILVCGAGMSTSLMCKKIQDAARDASVEAEVKAMGLPDFQVYKGEVDAALIAPQISYKTNTLKKERTDVKFIETIPSLDYALMNGAKVLQLVLDNLKD